MKKLVCFIASSVLVASLFFLSACGAEVAAPSETEPSADSVEIGNDEAETVPEAEETAEIKEQRSTKYSVTDLEFDFGYFEDFIKATAYIDEKLYVFYNKYDYDAGKSDYRIAIIDPDTNEFTEEAVELALPYWYIPINEGNNTNPAVIEEDFDEYFAVFPDEQTTKNYLFYEGDDDEVSILSISDCTFDSEGNLCALLCDGYYYRAEGGTGHEEKDSIVKWTPEGDIMIKNPIFDSITLGRQPNEVHTTIQVVNDGSMFVSSIGDVYAVKLFSGDRGMFKDSHIFFRQGNPEFIKGRDDRLYFLNRNDEDEEFAFYEYIYENRETGEQIPAPEELKNYWKIFRGGEDYDILFEKDHKLFGYNIGEEESTVIMDYEESGLDLLLSNITWIDNERFVATYHDNDKSKDVLALFTRTEE